MRRRREAAQLAFRQKAVPPLDGVGVLRDGIPDFSRSCLRRDHQRHIVSRLPVEEIAEKHTRAKICEIGRGTAVKVHYYDNLGGLKAHALTMVVACNFDKHLTVPRRCRCSRR
jgi:hypothetical protein